MNKKNMKTLRRLTGNRAFSLVRLTTAVALISGAAAMAFVAASPGGAPQPDAASNMRVVNCDHGQNLAEALARAHPGDTIRVTGTCVEQVSIKTDRITLDGQGAATLDGGGGPVAEFDGVLTIDGASGVTIQGFTVQNGPGEGILGTHGAAFSVRNTTVQDNGSTGVAVAEGSTAELTDCRILRNGLGIDVYTQSSAVLKGSIRTNDNLTSGAEVNGTSILEIRGAQLEASRNGGFGLFAGSNSHLWVCERAGEHVHYRCERWGRYSAGRLLHPKRLQ
jgi:nitrous oxidase accessory protein NosD